MQPGAGAERESSTQPSADAGAPVSEGGLVGRVAQVGRRIVRSLLHPDGQGAGAEATAADGGAAAADAGAICAQGPLGISGTGGSRCCGKSGCAGLRQGFRSNVVDRAGNRGCDRLQ